MKFLPDTFVSKEDFLSHMGYNQGIPVGETVKPPMKELKSFLRLWTKRIDAMLHNDIIKEGSTIYLLYENERGFTFEEFKLLFANVDEEKYDLYPIFKALQIPNKDMLVELLTHYENNDEGYFEALKLCIKRRKMQGLPFFFTRMNYEIDVDHLKRHAYISGSTGSGKSNLMRILIHWLQRMSNTDLSQTIIVIDPHGELSNQIKKSPINVENPERFILVDPGIKDNYTPIINPLEIEWENDVDVVNHAQNLSIAIENIIGSDLSKNMSALLVPCLSLLIRKKDSSFLDLIKLMYDDPDLIKEGLQLKNRVHKNLFKDFYKKYKQSKPAIAARFQSFLNFPSFDHLTNGRSTINLEKTVNSGKVIVFNLSQDHFGEEGSPALGRLLIAMIKSIAIKRGRKNKGHIPTFLFVDECQEFVSKSMKKILKQTRKFGLHLILANQSVDDLGDIRDTVLTNTYIKCIGQSGSPDSHKALANSTGTPYETIANLADFEFLIKSQGGSGAVIKPFDILLRNKSYSINKKEEKLLDEHLVKRYYQEIKNDENDDTGDMFRQTKFDL